MVSFTLRKITTISLTIMVVWVMFLGLFQITSHMQGEAGMSGNCPLMPGHSAAICRMNPLEHIQEWQKMFTSLPIENSAEAILALLSLFLLGSAFLKTSKLYTEKLSEAFFQRLYFNFLFDPLEKAYARGILNPKLF